MPRLFASEVAESSGVAASRSRAAAAREFFRRPATARRAASQARSRVRSKLQGVVGLGGQGGQEFRHPGRVIPGRVGAQRRGAGQRHGHAEQAVLRPMANEGGAERRPAAADVEPGVGGVGGGEQRRAGLGGERRGGAPDVSLLVEVGRDQPLGTG